MSSFRPAATTWDRYDTRRPLDAWFKIILRHAFLDSRKRHYRRLEVRLDCSCDGYDSNCFCQVPQDEDDSLEAKLERDEAARMVWEALARLSKDGRKVVTLSDMQGLKYSEVGAKLGILPGTVRSRLHRARKLLRGFWQELQMVADWAEPAD